MRIVALKTLRQYWEMAGHQDCEQPLKSWYAIAKTAKWKTPQDIKDQFGNSSIIGNNRAVFNIAGNKYRLIVAFNYSCGIGFVKFIGTHAEYDKIDAETYDGN